VPACQFRLLRGHDGVSGYQFFAHSAHHFFCVRCGVHAFSHHFAENAEPLRELYTIDLRCVHPRASRVAQSGDGAACEPATAASAHAR